MPMDMVPAHSQSNQLYRQRVIDNELKMNPSAERAIDAALNRNPPRPESVPAPIWMLAKLAMAPATEIASLVTIGEIDPAIRDKFGISFSTDEQKQLEEIRTVMKAFIDPLPDPLRYAPQAYESLLRDRDGEHKNATDHLIHSSMILGASAVERVVGRVTPLFRQAQKVSHRFAGHQHLAAAA